MAKKQQIKNGILRKVIRIKESIDRHAAGGYPEFSTEKIVNYIWWLNKYKKAPQKIINDLTEYMNGYYSWDDEIITKYHDDYDVIEEWKAQGWAV